MNIKNVRTLICACVLALWGMAVLPAVVPAPVWALDAEEILSDPTLENRARGLSQQLRCLVCQNQSIDDSDADLAKDLRREVRQQLVAGKSDEDILAFLREQYGDYVLLDPPVTKSTYLLWMAPWLMVAMAVGLFWMYRRTPLSTQSSTAASTADKPIKNTAQEDRAAIRPSSSVFWAGSVGIIILILGVSVGIYSQIGRPDLVSQPLNDRASERSAAEAETAERNQDIQDELEAARRYVSENPESVEAYLRLGMAAATARAFSEEIAALRTALDLTDGNIAITSMLAEALSRQADGLVTLPARQLVNDVLARDPDEPRALFIAGLAAFQDEDYQTALDYWMRLEQISTPDAPWNEMLSQNIVQAAEAGGISLPQPSQPAPDTQLADQIMALPADEQQEMIQSMVDSLEDRLAQDPSDAEGWNRLIRARRTLDDADGLMRALFGAAAALQDDAIAQLAAIEEMLARGMSSDYLDRAKDALERLQQLRPEGLESLFFSGHFARLEGRTAQAIDAWQQLYDRLPQDSEFAQQLAEQIATLKR